MLMDNAKEIIGKVFNELADALEKGEYGKKVRVGLTTLGSEHGVEELVRAGEMAQRKFNDIEVVLIGDAPNTDLKVYPTSCEADMHRIMEELLEKGEIDACVTMHYNFPLGVSTVGRVITPGFGKELTIATTTGTSSANRVEAMVKNAIYGIIVEKAIGNPEPTVGILNVDGARQVERILKELASNGYPIKFAESMRSDGGCVMRGNDLLAASSNVMVTDTLTGNLLIKIFSAFTTGGNYESIGYGYGPGIGEGFNKLILILSRASGAPVAVNAIRYAADLVKGKVLEIARKEFELANKAGLKAILERETKKSQDEPREIKMPPKKVVTSEISGIDILELENAVKTLWKNHIYAESGMGCTGPIVLVSPEDLEKALDILKSNGFIGHEFKGC